MNSLDEQLKKIMNVTIKNNNGIGLFLIGSSFLQPFSTIRISCGPILKKSSYPKEIFISPV
jgi:hypothetical protein